VSTSDAAPDPDGAETFELTAKPLLEEAHARLARQQGLRDRTG
jgi:hypothetical protein